MGQGQMSDQNKGPEILLYEEYKAPPRCLPGASGSNRSRGLRRFTMPDLPRASGLHSRLDSDLQALRRKGRGLTWKIHSMKSSSKTR